MNRLMDANHKNYTTSWTAGEYDEGDISYDLRGNIKTLKRKGKDGGQDR